MSPYNFESTMIVILAVLMLIGTVVYNKLKG